MSQVDSDKKTTSGERETKHLTMCFELHKVAVILTDITDQVLILSSVCCN